MDAFCDHSVYALKYSDFRLFYVETFGYRSTSFLRSLDRSLYQDANARTARSKVLVCARVGRFVTEASVCRSELRLFAARRSTLSAPLSISPHKNKPYDTDERPNETGTSTGVARCTARGDGDIIRATGRDARRRRRRRDATRATTMRRESRIIAARVLAAVRSPGVADRVFGLRFGSADGKRRRTPGTAEPRCGLRRSHGPISRPSTSITLHFKNA